jgi:hypothetical protein
MLPNSFPQTFNLSLYNACEVSQGDMHVAPAASQREGQMHNERLGEHHAFIVRAAIAERQTKTIT